MGAISDSLRNVASSHDPGPEAEVERTEELCILRNLMVRLPSRCREVYELIAQGLTQREVSERLQIDVKAVQKQVSRGRRLLKTMAVELGLCYSMDLSQKLDGGES